MHKLPTLLKIIVFILSELNNLDLSKQIIFLFLSLIILTKTNILFEIKYTDIKLLHKFLNKIRKINSFTFAPLNLISNTKERIMPNIKDIRNANTI